MGSIWGPFGRESLSYHAAVSAFHSIDCSRARKPASPPGVRGRQPNLRHGRRWGTAFSARDDLFLIAPHPSHGLPFGRSRSHAAHVASRPRQGECANATGWRGRERGHPDTRVFFQPYSGGVRLPHARIFWDRTSSRMPFLHSRARSTRGF